jgi:predicted house-cleaning noncanonical NTP pyrophosphatase (MazG superfamily)
MEKKKFTFNKLVRNKIPSLMSNQGVEIIGRTVDISEYLEQLKAKIYEEAKEVMLTQNKEQLIEELADLTEVISALSEVASISESEITKARLTKSNQKGLFSPSHYIDHILVQNDNVEVIKFLEDRGYTPEI